MVDHALTRAPLALPLHADLAGRRVRAARKLPCDPVPGGKAEPTRPVWGGVLFVAPAGAYAGLPAWRSRTAWLLSLRSHPRLAEACAATHIRQGLFLTIMRELSRYAQPGTGREIAVRHAVIAESVGVCTKTVQRATFVAYQLGALHLVLAGVKEMTLAQRSAVLDAYGRGVASRSWRSLPNFYAAVMPADAVARVRAVDNRPRPQDHCPASGTGGRAGSSAFSTYIESSFTSGCGQAGPPRAGPSSPEGQDRPDAPRRTQRQERASRPGPVLTSALMGYAAALCARLPGYRNVSLARIGPALSRYLDAGLSPADLTAGLDGYCRAHGITWISSWSAEHRTEQARYLVGMLTRARLAGHITPRG